MYRPLSLYGLWRSRVVIGGGACLEMTAGNVRARPASSKRCRCRRRLRLTVSLLIHLPPTRAAASCFCVIFELLYINNLLHLLMQLFCTSPVA